MGRYNTSTTQDLPPEHIRVPRSGVIPKIQQDEVAQEDAVMNAIIMPSSEPKQENLKAPNTEAVQSDALFFTRNVLGEAINKGASDVHFEPKKDSYLIRFRIDGVLQFYAERSIAEYEQILNSVKVLGDMDIAEKSIPQDGHIELVHEVVGKHTGTDRDDEVGHYFDIRVSVFPSVDGEVIVMRILNRENALYDIDELGMDTEMLDSLNEVLLNSHGMILITGPTGSGKTTTLYSIMNELKSSEKNIITLEDPIEFHLDWLRQCEIRERRGFTYEKAMESVLRQDPDVLMVGEIRDGKTAEHAVRSALIGRIVGSTIHANTTIGTIARLVELGVTRSVIGHTLNVIIAQRLVRKICQHCKEVYEPAMHLRKYFGLEKIDGPYYRGRGCKECENNGYKGRVGIFSLMKLDETTRNYLFEQRPLIDIQNYAYKQGMKSLKVDAAEKILKGITSLEEAARVI